MSNYQYRGFRIKVERDKITVTKITSGTGKTEDRKKDYMELRVSRIFHKALNRYRLTGIFEKNDYEILGDFLYKILMDNQTLKNVLLPEFSDIIRNDNIRCRIYLEFEDADDVAILPWEYIRVPDLEVRDTPAFFLGADPTSSFDLIRSVGDEKVDFTPQPGQALRIFLYIASTAANGQPTVDQQKLIKCFERLQAKKKFKDIIKIKARFLTPRPASEKFEEVMANELAAIDEPYIFHFFGHAMMDDKESRPCIGMIGGDEKVQWVSDKKFAEFFDPVRNANKLDARYPMPKLVVLQACESGQVNEDGRGIAIQIAKKKIPAVVAMQNEVTPDDSIAFIEKFYECILCGDDVAEAVTRSRTYLGNEYSIKQGSNNKDDAGQMEYRTNIFGTPVLFISTEEPIRLMPSLSSEQPVKKDVWMICTNKQCKEKYKNPQTEICRMSGCGSPLEPYVPGEDAAPGSLRDVNDQHLKRKLRSSGLGGTSNIS